MVIHYTNIYNRPIVVFSGKKACIFRFKGRKSCANGDSVDNVITMYMTYWTTVMALRVSPLGPFEKLNTWAGTTEACL